jgi:hypothetical protein
MTSLVIKKSGVSVAKTIKPVFGFLVASARVVFVKSALAKSDADNAGQRNSSLDPAASFKIVKNYLLHAGRAAIATGYHFSV